MRCDEARPLLAAGEPAAEPHLATCDACFAWLEAEGPLTAALRAARPAVAAAPAGLAPAVLAAWRRPPLPAWAAGLAAALLGALAVAGYGLAAALLGGPLDLLGSILGTLAPAVSVPRSLLVSNPALLTSLAVLGLAAGAGWLRLYVTGRVDAR